MSTLWWNVCTKFLLQYEIFNNLILFLVITILCDWPHIKWVIPFFQWQYFPDIIWLASKFKQLHALLSNLNHSQHWRQCNFLPGLVARQLQNLYRFEMLKWVPLIIYSCFGVFFNSGVKGLPIDSVIVS